MGLKSAPSLIHTAQGLWSLRPDGSGTINLTSPAGVNLGWSPSSNQNIYGNGPLIQGGPFSIGDRFAFSQSTITSTSSMGYNTSIVVFLSNASAQTLTLYTAGVVSGYSVQYRFKNIGAGTWTIQPQTGEYLEGVQNGTLTLTNKQNVDLASDGANHWWIV